MRRSELVDKMTVLLGGRAAERLVFGEPSTGAADDLARATDVARDMVLRYGMDEGLGPVSYADGAQSLLPGEAVPARAGRPGAESERRIDAAVQALLRDAQDRAVALLDANRHVLDRCAAELMAHEMLDEAALQSLTTDLRAGAEPLKPAPIRKAA
jgi:cell division protease FtsH